MVIVSYILGSCVRVQVCVGGVGSQSCVSSNEATIIHDESKKRGKDNEKEKQVLKGIQYKSPSTRDLGLEQIHGISDFAL